MGEVLRTTQRHGNGNENHLPSGHMKWTRNGYKPFIGGNGCKHSDSCLTCPLDDCDWGKSPNDK
jgi:hypothetical protein